MVQLKLLHFVFWNTDGDSSWSELGFWAFLEPGPNSRNVTNFLVMFLQLWKFTELFRNFRFSMAHRVVEEVEEHNVSIGQLKKISKQLPKLDGRLLSKPTDY